MNNGALIVKNLIPLTEQILSNPSLKKQLVATEMGTLFNLFHAILKYSVPDFKLYHRTFLHFGPDIEWVEINMDVGFKVVS